MFALQLRIILFDCTLCMFFVTFLCCCSLYKEVGWISAEHLKIYITGFGLKCDQKHYFERNLKKLYLFKQYLLGLHTSSDCVPIKNNICNSRKLEHRQQKNTEKCRIPVSECLFTYAVIVKSNPAKQVRPKFTIYLNCCFLQSFQEIINILANISFSRQHTDEKTF